MGLVFTRSLLTRRGLRRAAGRRFDQAGGPMAVRVCSPRDTGRFAIRAIRVHPRMEDAGGPPKPWRRKPDTTYMCCPGAGCSQGSALRPEQVTLTLPEKWKFEIFPFMPVA